MGPEVKELEEKLAKYLGMNYCITCSSGTDALLIPLMAYGIGRGDAVITTSFSYIATAEVISLVGAVPIFVDILPSTFNIDPDGIENAIQKASDKGLSVKAIIPVDLFGLPARYRKIKKIAQDNDLIIIEDFAQGFGGSIKGKKAGTFGEVSSTSFFPAKPLGCYGDGGAIFTDDQEMAEIMKSIRVHGSGSNKYENIRVGLNARMDTIQAAILLEKLSIFKQEIIKRNEIAKNYSQNINSRFIKPYVPKEYSSSWAQYCLLSESEVDRKNIIQKLKASNIPSMIYYKTPLHLQQVYSDLNYSINDFPVSESVSKRIFSLPMHPYLSEKDQSTIIRVINE